MSDLDESGRKPEVTKECALPRCHEFFTTRMSWKRFCCNEHKNEYWNTVHQVAIDMMAKQTS